jgi:glycosyltransferase involved in cell wall biosynthesis
MKLSVVTVCRNSEKTIRHTLESFLQQTHPHKELVVVDGASTDDTLAIVRSFADASFKILSEPDRGLYDAMNKGLARFTGDAVGFLNSDDRFKDRFSLTRIAAALEDSDIVFADLDFVQDHENRNVTRRWRGSPFRKGAFRQGWMPAHPTFYVRRPVVDTVGRFDLSYPIASDYDYMLRALELTDFRSRYLDVSLVEMMAGGKSNAGLLSYLKSNLQALRSRRAWLNAGVIDKAMVAKPLRKINQFFPK